MYPYGPICEYMYQYIPCLVAVNETGTITSSIIVPIMKHIDKHAPLHRTATTSRFLLFDGHQTRFQEYFLVYANTPETKWVCCIGLPYNTKFWQVGDAEKINGKYSSEINEAKRKLYKIKTENGYAASILSTDIIPIVRMSWEKNVHVC